MGCSLGLFALAASQSRCVGCRLRGGSVVLDSGCDIGTGYTKQAHRFLDRWGVQFSGVAEMCLDREMLARFDH